MYYDWDTERVKITSHCKFDEDFNDLPTESVPLGFQQLVQANRDEPIPADDVDISSSDLDFFVYPFANKQIIDVSGRTAFLPRLGKIEMFTMLKNRVLANLGPTSYLCKYVSYHYVRLFLQFIWKKEDEYLFTLVSITFKNKNNRYYFVNSTCAHLTSFLLVFCWVYAVFNFCWVFAEIMMNLCQD